MHCLLIEVEGRLILVDTGMGAADMAHPVRSLGLGMAWGGGASAAPTALAHVRRLGFGPGDVTDILMTHLDKDHAGGLADFPEARVHVTASELKAAQARGNFIDRQRYNPRHFAHGQRWLEYSEPGELEWKDIPAWVARGLPDSILLLSLLGHSAGHCGVAIHMDDGRWLVHCGDAVYHPAWLAGRKPPLAIQAVESLLEYDAGARRATRAKLAELAKQPDVKVFCSHDRAIFAALGGVE